MAQKKITASELRAQAQELLRTGKMPNAELLAKVLGETRAEYVPKLKKLRKG